LEESSDLEEEDSISEQKASNSDSEYSEDDSVFRAREKRRRRSDIPNKAIIRLFRKHFISILSKKCDFISKKRTRGIEFYKTCVTKLIDDTTKLEPTPLLVFYLAALLYHKDAEKSIDCLTPPSMTKEEALKEIRWLHRFRSVYTHEGMKRFIRIKPLAALFLEFSTSEERAKLPSATHKKSLNYFKQRCSKVVSTPTA